MLRLVVLTIPTEQEKANDSFAEAAMMPLSLFPIYLALSATSHEATATADQIKTTVTSWVPEAADDTRVVQACQEVARARGGELHNLSALTGGMVAQEAIKVMTKQYVPADCIVVYDGIRSRTGVFRFAGRGVA